ncbi:MAG: hypothetical protein WAV31_03115 [Candidatus Moraniibacteriota bacterium]
MKTLVFCVDDEAKKEAVHRFRLYHEDVVFFSEIKEAFDLINSGERVTLIVIDLDMPEGTMFLEKVLAANLAKTAIATMSKDNKEQ